MLLLAPVLGGVLLFALAIIRSYHGHLNTARQALLVVVIVLVAALYARPSRPAHRRRHQIGRVRN